MAMNSPVPRQAVAAVGDVIAGKYRVESTLGTGGMGIVFAATHLDLERLVAVKVMRAEMGEHPGAVERLVLEAKLAARFRSEHVCKVLDVGTLSDGAPYIVMEYLEGADLATLLTEQGAFEVSTAIDFMMQACEALTEAHAAQIVHRDLKPENLFVARLMDGTPSIKVLDFGISKQVGGRGPSRNLTNPSAALGSPFYMAPEQMRAARDVDARADIWAMGTILFELLTAQQAFAGDTLPEVCANVMNIQPPRVCDLDPELPVALADAIERCLRKDPALRFNDIGELAAALAPFGSAKALASLERIERALTGKGLGVAGLAKDPTGRYRLAASSVRSGSKPGLKATPTGPPLHVTLLDDRADSSAKPKPGKQLSRWLLLVALTSAGGLGVLAYRAARSTEPRPSAAVGSPIRAPLAQPQRTEPPRTEPREAPEVLQVSPVAAPSVGPGPAALAPAAALAPVSKPGSARGRPHLAPARSPSPSVASAPPPSLAVVSASPAAPKKPKPSEAWDSTSFGPRH
jgi:eukaryotic-like serine/threonine-protein kinase